MKAFLLFIAFFLWIAPAIAPYNPYETSEETFLSATTQHWFGTDHLGRDVFSRLLWGGQSTLAITSLATGLSILFGGMLAYCMISPWRLVNGLYFGGTRIFGSIPPILSVALCLTLFGPHEIILSVALAFSQMPSVAQVIGRAIQQIIHKDYVTASYSFGATLPQRARFHILPNIRPIVLAYICLVWAQLLVASAGFRFLGLGGSLSTPEWGIMLAEGRFAFRAAPWVSIAPGLAITITVIWMNIIAERISRFKQ